MTGILLAAAVGLGMAAGVPALRFVDAGDGSFRFDTGILRGVIREGGKSDGFASMFHVPTGVEMAGKHGLMNYYRVFTAGKRFGDAARKRPSEARLLEDGSLEVRWPPAEDWPFELKATYRWVLPMAVEVETGARAERELKDFEVFLFAYLSLFGRDLRAGETARTRSRFAVSTEPDPATILRLWREFQASGH